MSKTVHRFTVEVLADDPFDALRAMSWAARSSEHQVTRIESQEHPEELVVELVEPVEA